MSTFSMSKMVTFHTIQFIINTQFSSFWPFDKTLSDATTPGKSRPESDGNEEVLHIPQSCLVSYLRHSLGESYPSEEMQTVYSAASADWVIFELASPITSSMTIIIVISALYLSRMTQDLRSKHWPICKLK